MPTDLSISDVLDLDYPGAPAWAADGAHLAAPVYEDDEQSLRVAAVGDDAAEPWRLAPAGGVADIAWAPEAAPDRLAVLTAEGDLLLANARNRTTERLSADVDADDIAWGPDGRLLAVYRDGQPCVFDLETGEDRRYDTPERGRFLGESRMLAFSPDGDRLAYRFVARDAKQVGVLDVATGDRVWQSSGPASTSSPAWLGDGRLLLDESGDSGRYREVFAVDVASGDRQTLFREEEEMGTVSRGDATVSPDGERIALALPLDGWEHVHVVDVESGERRQLTAGEFEDKGVADSSPQWLDDDTLVFASNREDFGERGLFAVTGALGDDDPDVTALVTGGTNVHPAPDPTGERLAYVYASRTHSPELRVSNLDGSDADAPQRVTESRVETWPVDPIEPARVSYESVGGLEIEAYLLDPRESPAVEDEEDLPAVVWVHGGPMRQMRDGWHPGRSYGLAYAFQQYLAHQGYVGLFVNYRGGIGYGREFREALFGNRGTDEMADIAAGADYLRDFEFVGDAVGMWGLSYGGYAALQLPGIRPEAFDVTVNIAGLADLEQYRDWAEETKYPAAASSQAIRLGGEPWESDRWAEASPKTHFENYETPLYSFHGTGDRYVDFEQLDVVVEELLDLGNDHEWEYYPDENHVFSKRATWRRALGKIETAFETELR